MENLLPRDKEVSPDGICRAYNDGLDGYVIHGADCKYVGIGWSGVNYDCKKPKPQPSYGGI